MSFTADDLRSLFSTHEFKVSFFPSEKWLTDMWSFMLEDIHASESDNRIEITLTFPREPGIEKFLESWADSLMNRDDSAAGSRDIVIIGSSETESPAVVRIARFSSASPLTGGTVITDSSVSAVLTCESSDEDFRDYIREKGGPE